MTLSSAAGRRLNWAGNHAFAAKALAAPATGDEAMRLIEDLPYLKALGTGHSFNDIADSPGDQLSLDQLAHISMDGSAGTVTVGPGVSYGKMAAWLDLQGYAVRNLASLPHISVVGGCSTATHGSGIRNGNLATAVSAISFLNGRGSLVTLTRAANPGLFPGAVVGLGALGVVTEITLDLVPRFEIAQTVYENLPFEELKHNLDAIFASAYSVSLFTDWRERRATQAWLKQIVSHPSAPAAARSFYGATLQKAKLHPIPGCSPLHCTEQQGRPGPWHDRLPHFRMDFTPSSGAELQSEYFVPREQAYAAILAVEQLRSGIIPHLLITELRTVAADDLWMSMAYERDSVAIHFTWKPHAEEVRALLPAIEEKLKPFDARPHWAKLFAMRREELSRLYPRFADFQALVKEHDPAGKFRNAFLNRCLYVD